MISEVTRGWLMAFYHGMWSYGQTDWKIEWDFEDFKSGICALEKCKGMWLHLTGRQGGSYIKYYCFGFWIGSTVLVLWKKKLNTRNDENEYFFSGNRPNVFCCLTSFRMSNDQKAHSFIINCRKCFEVLITWLMCPWHFHRCLEV